MSIIYKNWLVFIFIFFLISGILIKDVPRHGSILKAVDSWTLIPLFDLRDKEACYELRPGMLLVKKSSSPSPNTQEKEKTVPDGSVMKVAETRFPPEQYFYTCQHYRGYFITKNGPVEWVLTEIK